MAGDFDDCGMDIECDGPELGDDMSEFDDDLMPGEDDEPWDGFQSDAEADADVLASAGHGDDEAYNHYSYEPEDQWLDGSYEE